MWANGTCSSQVMRPLAALMLAQLIGASSTVRFAAIYAYDKRLFKRLVLGSDGVS